jgi:hypothetical protein
MNMWESVKFEVGYFFTETLRNPSLDFITGTAIVLTAFVVPTIGWYFDLAG